MNSNLINVEIATSCDLVLQLLSDYSTISDEIKDRVCDGTVVDIKSQGPVKFCIWVSFAEIYNEHVYDLFDPTPTGKGKKRTVLKLCGDKKGNPFIKGVWLSLSLYLSLSLSLSGALSLELSL